MDGRDLVYPLPFIAAVVDTLRAVVSLQIGIGKVSPCRPPNFRIFLIVPVHKVNLVGLVSATWQLHTLALFIKHIFLFGFRRPCAALVKGGALSRGYGREGCRRLCHVWRSRRTFLWKQIERNSIPEQAVTVPLWIIQRAGRFQPPAQVGRSPLSRKAPHCSTR